MNYPLEIIPEVKYYLLQHLVQPSTEPKLGFLYSMTDAKHQLLLAEVFDGTELTKEVVNAYKNKAAGLGLALSAVYFSGDYPAESMIAIDLQEEITVLKIDAFAALNQLHISYLNRPAQAKQGPAKQYVLSLGKHRFRLP